VEFVAFSAGHEFHELTGIKFSTVSETVKGRMNRLVLLIATLVNKTRWRSKSDCSIQSLTWPLSEEGISAVFAAA